MTQFPGNPIAAQPIPHTQQEGPSPFYVFKPRFLKRFFSVFLFLYICQYLVVRTHRRGPALFIMYSSPDSSKDFLTVFLILYANTWWSTHTRGARHFLCIQAQILRKIFFTFFSVFVCQYLVVHTHRRDPVPFYVFKPIFLFIF